MKTTWWEVFFNAGRLDVNVVVKATGREEAIAKAQSAAQKEASRYGFGRAKAYGASRVEKSFWKEFGMDPLKTKSPTVYDSGT